MRNVKDNSIEQNKRTVDPLVWFYVFVLLGIIGIKVAVYLVAIYQRLGAKIP